MINHKRVCVLTTVMVVISLSCFAQSWEAIKLSESPKLIEPEVNFLPEASVIDGMLDKHLEYLPVREFTITYKLKPDSLIPVGYRLAYGTRFFYVYVEAKGDRLFFRDRAYQNGDGFVMLLAKAHPGHEPTGEFYELACSAVNKPELEWTRRIFWNYNVDKLFVSTSDNVRMEFHEGNGRIGFELLLPWDDVRPYHPWISEGIGFNLTFTKAIEPDRKMYIGVVDDAVGGEFKKRLYATLQFERPSVVGKPQTFVSVRNGHITEGDSLRGIAVTISGKPFIENVTIRVEAGEGRIAARHQIEYACTSGVTTKEFVVGTGRLLEGGYMVKWSSRDSESRGASGLSILPKFLPAELNQRLNRIRHAISRGTYNTAQFLIQELEGKLAGLKFYETCFNERLTVASFMRMLNSAEQGTDPFAGKTGFIRKAYRSKVDSTLQPYVVYIPDGFNDKKKYPLLVFLHGSASDETNIAGFRSLIPDGFVALGPFGRGPSNGFCRDHAQDDIAEAIAAAEQEYPIDTARIVLSGFSMGGYGVYRTFYETPTKFRGLAVFSGGPSMGSTYAGETNPPDFSEERNLQSFRGIPIFVFHGEKDMNVPIGATKDLVVKLQKVGARVEYRAEADRGHKSPAREGIEAFKRWIEKVLNEEKRH